MKRYDAYKDSGIEWIGAIPTHWEVKRLKYIAEARPSNIDKKSKEGETEVFLCNYLDVYNNDFITAELPFMRSTASFTQIEKFSLREGDVIATKDSESPDDIGIAALVKQDLGNVVCGYHLTHIKPRTISGGYLFRQFQSDYVRSTFEVLANGITRYALGVDDFNSLKVIVPLSTEQTAIAAYLDRKTAEIDELIESKRRLLELYEEEKTAIINQAVTQGINPDAPMKDSGIDWLGEVPAHWEVKKVKQVVIKVGSGVTPTGGASVYQASGIPLLRSQNIHSDGLKMDDVAYISQDVHQGMRNSKVATDDILLNITGASIGRVYFVEDWLGEANVNQHVCILRPGTTIRTKFLYLVFRSMIGQEQIGMEQTGSGREGLNFEALKNFCVPVPPVTEQQSIVRYIQNESRRVDNQKARTQKMIDLLTEYRTALISEVVTGKVKVV